MQAVNRLSQVEPDSSAVQAARALGICFGDCPTRNSPFRKVEPLFATDDAPPADKSFEECETLVEEALST
jgi:hypothetical protein